MGNYQNWTLHVEDRIATLSLNRAEFRNSITPETLTELREITRNLKENPLVWAVVLEGAGDHFSVGVDVGVIGEMIGQEYEAYRNNLFNLQSCLDEFEALPKPTIAKIKGYCIGGGLILSLCCDFRIASDTAQFMLPEVKRGIPVLMGTQRLTRTIGLARTKELTMLGELIFAPQAYNYGLLTRIVEEEELAEETRLFADKFRHLPPRTLALCKQIATAGLDMSLRESQDLEILLQGDLLETEDFKEGVASFFEKRPPRFKGN